MAMTINTNVMSLNAQRNLSNTGSSLATSMQRLSSGLRVNSAKDDAAGLAIADRLNTQVRGSAVAVRNANDAISLFQTAEGALAKIGENIQRIREIAVQAANASLDETDRDNLQLEVTALQTEIARVADTTRFGKLNLLDDSIVDGTFQIGADEGDTIDASAEITAMNMTGLTSYAALDITGADGTAANGLLASLDDDIDLVNGARAQAGAIQSRFEAVVSQLQVYAENASAARGRIMDADFAVETANLSRAQILQQAGSAMVAQANQQPQQVMALLRNF
jgi:flagellin